MFSGIVETMGTVAAIEPTDAGRHLVIDPAGWAPEGRPLRAGDSVAVAGVCLTVAALGDGRIGFDVVPETLARTSLGDRAVGSRVNLEPSIGAGDSLGGHFVQGHVDAVAEVRSVETGEEWRIGIEIPAQIADCIVPKGSITIEGVSMTVASVDGDAATFDVAVIPTTLEMTTLGSLAAGDRVNLESDIIARTVVHYLAAREDPDGK